ncbi:B-lymphocyte antigen CD20-like isoform X1 [Prionailurus iriomotensis]
MNETCSDKQLFDAPDTENNHQWTIELTRYIRVKKESIHHLQFLYRIFIKMSEGYTLKLETRALGAVQIMNGLFYCALGFLCFALFVEEENREATGYIPVIVTLTYVFCSSTFFISSGSISVQAQKHPTKSKIAGSMLLQYILFTTIVEVICAYVTVKWIEAALRPVECSDISCLQQRVGNRSKRDLAASRANRNPMASAGPMANSMFVVAPPNGYPEIQGGMCQVPPYPSNQPQVHLIPVNPPGLKSSVTEQPAQRALKEGKVLGAIQILIGLIHMGLGSIMATVLSGHYTAISFYGGFPFWGGVWVHHFRIPLSVSRKSAKILLPGWRNGSLGLNIVSAICSVVGITLFIMDMSLPPIYARPDSYPYYDTWGVTPGVAISGVLLTFCLLEFGIACASSHLGCQLVCCQHNVGVVLPNVYMANPVVVPEPVNLPPTYSNEAQGSR